MTAVSGAGFDLNGLALRSPDDPVQFLWTRGERLKREVHAPDLGSLRKAMHDHLAERGEPAGYILLKTVALEVLARAHALHVEGQDMEAAVRDSRATLESALGGGERFAHYSTGESIESGTWGLLEWPAVQPLTDRVEVLTVNYLQMHPECSQLEVERLLCPELPGLFTPSARTILAVLSSYAEKQDSLWRLREEDKASSRQEELRTITSIIEKTGARLDYKVHRDGQWVRWEERGALVMAFSILASAIVSPVVMENPFPPELSVLVVPGGRLGLIAYKTAVHPALAEKLKDYRWQRFRLWRALADVKILTRESFEEQLASDPVDRAQGQMMMF
jgi:hypothetical protein